MSARRLLAGLAAIASVLVIGCSEPPRAPGTTPDARGGQGGKDGGGNNDADANTSTAGCGDWQTGTLTGYNNSDSGDDPNAGSVMEFSGLNANFYAHVDMAAVDMSDWDHDQYHYVDVDFDGTIGRVQAWDACNDADCPDGRMCCTENKRLFAQPGYLVDVETRTAARLWGVQDAEDTLRNEIRYRICDSFDPDPIAEKYGAHR